MLEASLDVYFVGLFLTASACIFAPWCIDVDPPHGVVRGLGCLPSSSCNFVASIFMAMVSVSYGGIIATISNQIFSESSLTIVSRFFAWSW